MSERSVFSTSTIPHDAWCSIAHSFDEKIGYITVTTVRGTPPLPVIAVRFPVVNERTWRAALLLVRHVRGDGR